MWRPAPTRTAQHRVARREHAFSATTRRGPRSGTSIWRTCAACTDSGPSRVAPARELVEQLREGGSAPMRSSTRNAGSRPASPSGCRPGCGATSSICSKRRSTPGVTRFVWLRQFEPGSNSADANRLLDRLEHLQRLAVPEGLFGDIPPHRITRAAPAGGALLRRRAARAPGQPPPRDPRGLRCRVGDVRRRRGGGATAAADATRRSVARGSGPASGSRCG